MNSFGGTRGSAQIKAHHSIHMIIRPWLGSVNYLLLLFNTKALLQQAVQLYFWEARSFMEILEIERL